MADGIDFKTIGLAAKDVIFGIATGAAGASGGPAGAQGVATASAGLDKLIALAPGDDKKKTPGDRMDRADRPKPAPPPPVNQPPPQPGPPPASSEEVASSNQGDAPWPPTGDARITADHLSSLGWSRERIQKILGGPEQTSLSEVTRQQPKGAKVAMAEGTRVATVDASPVEMTKGAPVRIAASERTEIVDGKKVADAEAVQITPASQVRIVDGRRVSKGGSSIT